LQTLNEKAHNLQRRNKDLNLENMNNEKRIILAIAVYAAVMTMIFHGLETMSSVSILSNVAIP
jgi:hypothetical protein